VPFRADRRMPRIETSILHRRRGACCIGSGVVGFCVGLLLAIAMSSSVAWPQIASKPKVRAVTAFVRIDRVHYQDELRAAIGFLNEAKQAYEAGGYEVQTIRITTQAFPDIVSGLNDAQALSFIHDMYGVAHAANVLLNIGPAMQSDSDPTTNADLLARLLAENDGLNGSIVVAADDGAHWNAIHAAARIVKYLENHSQQGTFQFAATAMLPPYDPFFPGSYHTGPGHHFSVGLQAANVVQHAFAANPGDIENAEKTLSAELARYDEDAERIASGLASRTGWTYEGIDPTPAPLGEVSIGGAIERFTGAPFGSSGTVTAAAMITRAVKSVGVKQVGYAGLMVPVLEDSVLAKRWSEGTYNVDALLAYSAVCATGLDTVPLPGDISEDQLARMIGDVATLAYKWKKPLAARLLPIAGKKVGDKTNFAGPFLSNAVVQKSP
jgi:uncharacterized protein